MKVTAILRKDQPDENGLCKILIRINKGNSRSYLTTDHKVRASQFKSGKVINHERAKGINQDLKKLIDDLTEHDTVTRKVTFHSYALAFISHAEKTHTRSKGTIRGYKSDLKKFLSFTDNLPLNAITPDIIKSYHIHMKGLGNTHNTVWKSLKFIKTLLNQALKEGLIRSNPFARCEPVSYKQTMRTFLTSDEVKQIAALKIDPKNPLFNTSRLFMLQCYTSLRVGDIKLLDRDRILKEKRIVIETEKTKELISIPLSKETETILKEVQRFDFSTEDYNRQLKMLATWAGITKTLTSHVARHTAAVRMAELGISKDVARKLLGHTTSKTTDIYYKIQDARVDKEFKGFGY